MNNEQVLSVTNNCGRMTSPAKRSSPQTQYHRPFVHFGTGWGAMLIAATLFIVAGCSNADGPERASVYGVVSLDGDQIQQGSIAFIPDGKTVGPTAGAVIENGRYSTDKASGPVLGIHRVEIVAHRAGKNVEVTGIGGSAAGPSATGTVQETEMYVPEQFNKKSTLTVTIKSGRNPENFLLLSNP